MKRMFFRGQEAVTVIKTGNFWSEVKDQSGNKFCVAKRMLRKRQRKIKNF